MKNAQKMYNDYNYILGYQTNFWIKSDQLFLSKPSKVSCYIQSNYYRNILDALFAIMSFLL